MKMNGLGVGATALIQFYTIFIYFVQFLYILYNFIYFVQFLYILYIIYISLYFIYILYIYIYARFISSLWLYIFTSIYTPRILSLYISAYTYILYISYIIHTPLCITSAEGDLSLRDKHLSVVFSLRSKPNKQFNVSFHNYSLGKNFTFIYI